MTVLLFRSMASWKTWEL